MATADDLYRFFTEGVVTPTVRTVGAEIETHCVQTGTLTPITFATAQAVLQHLVAAFDWVVDEHKGEYISRLKHPDGSCLMFELGCQNLELATGVHNFETILAAIEARLTELYQALEMFGAEPHFSPILDTGVDQLVILDERDALYCDLDGEAALALLTGITGVQWTFSVDPGEAIQILNRIGAKHAQLMTSFDQDRVWRQYIVEAEAGYMSSRYGGPDHFGDLYDYCQELSHHAVLMDGQLVPFQDAHGFDIPGFLRTVWWRARLKRYGQALCVETRFQSRRRDDSLKDQLGMMRHIAGV